MAIKFNSKNVASIKFNGKNIKEVRQNGKLIYPTIPIVPMVTCKLIGFEYKGIGEGGLSVGGVNKHVLVEPLVDNPTKETIIEYPQDCVSFMDNRYRYDTPYGAQDAMYTHIAYTEFANGSLLYEALWNMHAPVHNQQIAYNGNYTTTFKFFITDGLFTIKKPNNYYIQSEGDAGSINILNDQGVVDPDRPYDIGRYNSNPGSGSIDVYSRPLLRNLSKDTLTISLTKRAGVQNYTLEPYDNAKKNYLRIDHIAFDPHSGKYVDINITVPTT